MLVLLVGGGGCVVVVVGIFLLLWVVLLLWRMLLVVAFAFAALFAPHPMRQLSQPVRFKSYSSFSRPLPLAFPSIPLMH